MFLKQTEYTHTQARACALLFEVKINRVLEDNLSIILYIIDSFFKLLIFKLENIYGKLNINSLSNGTLFGYNPQENRFLIVHSPDHN